MGGATRNERSGNPLKPHSGFIQEAGAGWRGLIPVNLLPMCPAHTRAIL